GRFIETMKAFELDVTEEDHNEFQNMYTSIAYHLIKPNPVYNELLKRLSEKYTLAIMTNGSSGYQREKIKRLEMEDIFQKDLIFISEEVGYSKPSPEIYQKAINWFKIIPSKILFV